MTWLIIFVNLIAERSEKMKYQEHYNKLLEELTELEIKNEELENIVALKDSEKDKLSLKVDELDVEITKLESKKIDMLYSKKIDTNANIFAVLSIVVPTLIGTLIMIPNITSTNVSGAKVLTTFLIAASSFAGTLLITLALGRLINQKERKKIVNSKEFQQLIEEIKSKKIEKEQIKKQLQVIIEDLDKALSASQTQHDLVDNKMTEIQKLKDDVFYSIVDAPNTNVDKSKKNVMVRTKKPTKPTNGE